MFQHTMQKIKETVLNPSATVFGTKQILSLEMHQGNPEWKYDKIEHLSGAYWRFYPNGTFAYAPANAREDLYPLKGTYQLQGNSLVFSGESDFRSRLGSSARAIVNGQIDWSRGQPVLKMNAVSGSSSARFNTTSAYSTQILLYQVK
ncbi:MAG: hypothetical protein WBM44_31235 [Waterburya sp.]